jgi:Uma2 family endonuclease
MATQPQTGLTYEDLQKFPDDNLRRELIDGELIVTAAPTTRHQRVVVRLIRRLGDYCDAHGGETLTAPFDVFFSEKDVVEPDVIFVREENRDRFEEKLFRSAPDVVIEVSSPSTRRIELIRKRDLYERYGVPEYWFVDLDADRVEIYRLVEGRFSAPLLTSRGETITTPQAPGLELPVDDLLGPSAD